MDSRCQRIQLTCVITNGGPMRMLAFVFVLGLLHVGPVQGDSNVEKGTVSFDLKDDQKHVPERYRLEPHTFPYEMKPLRAAPKFDVYHVTFPSPVETNCKENN